MKTVARAADGSSFRSTDTPQQVRYDEEAEEKVPPSCDTDALRMRAAMSSHDDEVIYDARTIGGH